MDDVAEARVWRERAEAAEAENERHRRANLVRAVTEGFNAWIVEAVNAEEWDRVPWSVAMILKNENRRLREALRGIEQKFPKSDAAWLARAALAATEEEPDGVE